MKSLAILLVFVISSITNAREFSCNGTGEFKGYSPINGIYFEEDSKNSVQLGTNSDFGIYEEDKAEYVDYVELKRSTKNLKSLGFGAFPVQFRGKIKSVATINYVIGFPQGLFGSRKGTKFQAQYGSSMDTTKSYSLDCILK